MAADGNLVVDQPPASALAEALVEANDQLLALYELASVTMSSLDGRASAARLLERAGRLLLTDALQLEANGVTVVEGDSPTRRLDADRRSEHGGDSSSASASSTAVVEVSNSVGMHATLTAHRRSQPIGTADQKLLTAVAQMALAALHTSRLHDEAVAQAVMANEHDAASELASLALPRWRPEVPGVEIFARSDPVRSAGGDLFTFAVVDDVLHFVVGDVAGKGLPAAIIMATVISSADTAFQLAGSEGPTAVLRAVDAAVYDYLSSVGRFVTVVAGSFDSSSGLLQLANAGHSPVAFVVDRVAEPIPASVPPLGVVSFEVLGSDAIEQVALHPCEGDRLVICSDGFTEQEDSSGRMFGDEPLLETARSWRDSTAELGSELFDRLERHADGAPQSDDRTLLVIGFDEGLAN